MPGREPDWAEVLEGYGGGHGAGADGVVSFAQAGAVEAEVWSE